MNKRYFLKVNTEENEIVVMNVSDDVMVEIFRIKDNNAEVIISLLKGAENERNTDKCGKDICQIDY